MVVVVLCHDCPDEQFLHRPECIDQVPDVGLIRDSLISQTRSAVYNRASQ